MKIKTMITAILLASLPFIAQAQDNPQEPPVKDQPGGWVWVQQPEEVREQAPAKMVEAAFLGVNAEPLDFDTAKLLGVPQGTGLMIGFVAEDGPAAKAGLKKGDVLTRLDDQLLVNAEQLAVLVRTHKAGDAVNLNVLRDGEPIQLKAELVTREVPELGPGGANLSNQWRVQVGGPARPGAEGFPGLWIGDGALPQLLGEPIGPANEDFQKLIQQLQQQMRQLEQHRVDVDQMMQQMRQQLNLDIDQLRGQIEPGFGDAAAQHAVRASMTSSDGEHTISIKIEGDKRHLTVKDAAGNKIFDGELPADGKIPVLDKAVQDKVNALISKTRVRNIEPGAERERPTIKKQADLPEGEWGFFYSGDYILKLNWDGKQQTMKVYAKHFAPWWLDTVEDFRVDPNWQKGEADKLHVAAFDRLEKDMQDAIYEMLNDEQVKPMLLAAEAE